MTPETPLLRVVIADDEPPARDRLCRLLAMAGGTECVGVAADGMEALALIQREQPDVAILDIHMPGIDGIRVVEALDDPPAIIFSTAHEEHAVRAFDLDVIDYLLKPYSAERLRRALDRVRRLLLPTDENAGRNTEPVRIRALDGLSTVFVAAEEVDSFRIEEGVVFLLREDGERLVCEETLREIEACLPSRMFFRASRQGIVNLHAIRSHTPHAEGGLSVRLRSGIEEVVSRRRARLIRARLADTRK